MKIKLFFAWYDCWIGFYYDRHNKVLFIGLLPMILIKIWRSKWYDIQN